MGVGERLKSRLRMKYLLTLCLCLSAVLAQETYSCPDGWEKEEDRSGCRCFLISEDEAVIRDDADVLCAAHGSWVAELDHPGINYWLKSKLLDKTQPGVTEQFWLGAVSGERHSENAPGEWTCLIRTKLWAGLTG